MEADEAERISDEELIGQMSYVGSSQLEVRVTYRCYCSTLLFAAFDTTSSALARILYLLAEHPEVQEKLRKEITEARREKGNLDYDDLVGLPYLEAVCRETLRV